MSICAVYAREKGLMLIYIYRNGSKLFYRDKAERWRAYLLYSFLPDVVPN